MQGDDPGLAVARIALGCGNFGGVGSAPDFFGQGMTEDEAFALMDAAWEAGIDWFDTADAYGGGRSERAIGRWMAGYAGTLLAFTFFARFFNDNYAAVVITLFLCVLPLGDVSLAPAPAIETERLAV